MENSRNNHPCFLGAMLNFGGVVSFLGVFFSQPNWMNRLFDGLFLWGPLNKNTFIFQGVLGLQGWEASIWMEANHLWTSFPAGICLLGGRLSGAYLWRDFNTFANNQEWTLDQWKKTQTTHWQICFFDCICTYLYYVHIFPLVSDDLSPSYMGSNKPVTLWAMGFHSGFLAGLQGDQMRTEVSQMGRDACTKYKALLKGS